MSKKEKIIPDLSKAKRYFVFYDDGEMIGAGIHGKPEEVMEMIAMVIADSEEVRFLIKTVMDFTEQRESGNLFPPTPPEEVN